MSDMFQEMTSSACEGCKFLLLEAGCCIPGHTCWKRKIDGMPSRTVGDVLEALGWNMPEIEVPDLEEVLASMPEEEQHDTSSNHLNQGD